MHKRKQSQMQVGFTLIELMVTLLIMGILASLSMPMLQLTARRQQESELKQSLQEMRQAIDAYKVAVDQGRIKKTVEQSGYPPSLEILVEGVEDVQNPKHPKIKFLRRVPLDPTLTQTERLARTARQHDWNLRSYETPPDSPSYTQDVFDVYSTNHKIGINGIPYAEW